MPLQDRIEEWKKYPNALGSEAGAAVIVGEVANAVGEDVPTDVKQALKALALRGVMRDVASAIQRGEEMNPRTPSFHDLVDVGATAAGISWTEAVSVITKYIDSRAPRAG
jgi:hypothetical protein